MSTTTKNISHSGVKGMKWGIRRYQNADGSLTELGKKRYGNVKSEDLDKTLKEAVDNDLKSTKTMLGEGAKAANTVADYVTGYKPDVARLDLSSMSNDELRTRIQREQLEKQYDQMFNPKRAEVERGRDEMARFLKGASAAITTTGSILGIALAIKQLRNG